MAKCKGAQHSISLICVYHSVPSKLRSQVELSMDLTQKNLGNYQ